LKDEDSLLKSFNKLFGRNTGKNIKNHGTMKLQIREHEMWTEIRRRWWMQDHCFDASRGGVYDDRDPMTVTEVFYESYS
jgi:hypothetical protein